jgi:mRNA interferase MazF
MYKSEIWLVNLNPTIGSEITKTRPVVIVSNDTIGVLPLRVIVPITDWKSHYYTVEWMVQIVNDSINNLTKHSSIDCFQVRNISTERFVRKIGDLTIKQMDEIQIALTKVLF